MDNISRELKSIDFKIENFLPAYVVVVGLGCIIGGIYSIQDRIAYGIVLVVFGLLVSTTHHRIRVNFGKGYHYKYVWVLGLEIGKKIKFNTIEYFFITQSKFKQVYGQSYKNHYVKVTYFNLYLKFNENEKILIGKSLSKKYLYKKIELLNLKLGLEIKDYS